MPRITIAPSALALIRELEAAGHEAYAVGGCVRDSLRGETPHDWDICTSATPDEMRAVFAHRRTVDTGIKHGTLTVLCDGEPFEITTFRVDGGYSDGRHPDGVSFTRRLAVDLSRRDFTINAMAAGSDGEVVDLFGGIDDLDARLIRCVGDARTRFDEDALRILRALRFASTLGFSLRPDTALAVHACRDNLRLVSAERIFDELMRLLEGEHSADILERFPDVFGVFIPEIEPCVNFEHRNRWHCFDVWTHTCRAIAHAPCDAKVRLALLFHDVAKPLCAVDRSDGRRSFHGHPQRSAEIAEARLRALHAPRALVELTRELTLLHDDPLDDSTALCGKYLRRLGDDGALALCEVQLADALAHNLDHPPAVERVKRVEAARERMRRLIEDEAPYLPSRLAVNGHDLAALGFEGVHIARALTTLCDLATDGAVANDRAALLAAAKSLR